MESLLLYTPIVDASENLIINIPQIQKYSKAAFSV